MRGELSGQPDLVLSHIVREAFGPPVGSIAEISVAVAVGAADSAVRPAAIHLNDDPAIQVVGDLQAFTLIGVQDDEFPRVGP